MTFVAQNFEQFADDLLTALTGGTIREEHRFVGVEESYSLASPGADPRTVKVFGQRNNAFTLFTRGIDFDYQPDPGLIVWKEKGALPDDRSYFYVNYYVEDARQRLTDRNPGSVTTTLAEAFAREYAVLHKQMEMIYRSAFVDWASGVSLDYVAGLLAVTRKNAKFAGGEALFKRSTPAGGDITIAAGTVISTDLGQNFETTDKRTLRRGQLSVLVPIRAAVEGLDGRVDAASIRYVNRPILGIETVINEAATFFATEKETDDELRRRIKSTLERAGKSTLSAIKFSLIEEIPGVNEGNVQVSELPEPGNVEVKFGLGSAVDPDLVRRIEETIFYSRPAGVRVKHNLPTRSFPPPGVSNGATRPEVAGHLASKGGPVPTIHVSDESLKRLPEGVLPLQIEVMVRLVEANLTAAQREKIEDEVRGRVIDFIDALPMGAVLVYNKLLGRIADLEQVSDCTLLIRTASADGAAATEAFKANLATDGRKATVEPRQVSVFLMDEAVLIDMRVTLESKPPAQGRIDSTTESAINQSIQDTFAAARGKLSREDLRSVVTNALAGSDLQLGENGALVINAEYEQTGRLLNNTEQLTVEEHQVLRLRDLQIGMKGALDA
jgi:uncharacterized phage protein gp47/JayE